MASRAGGNGQCMLALHHFQLKYSATLKDAKITGLLELLHQLLHIREGLAAKVKVVQHCQPQPSQTKPQAIPPPVRRLLDEAAVEQRHENAMRRRFVQSCGFHDLRESSLGVFIVER